MGAKILTNQAVLGIADSNKISNFFSKLTPAQRFAALGAMGQAQLEAFLGKFNPTQLTNLLSGFTASQIGSILNRLPPALRNTLPLGSLVPGMPVAAARTVPINGAINGIELANVDINVSIGPDRLQTSLQNLVKTSLNGYITTNFSHRFLGGAATALDYAPRAGNDYNCSYMDRVYHLAKCTDIVTDDRFWRFSELIDPDPRLLRRGYSGNSGWDRPYLGIFQCW